MLRYNNKQVTINGRSVSAITEANIDLKALNWNTLNIVTCRPIVRERLGKHIPAAKNTQAPII
jgi:hypothetical protein